MPFDAILPSQGQAGTESPRELRRMAYRMLELADRMEWGGGDPSEDRSHRFESSALAASAATIRRVRRRRVGYFDMKLFGEPAWDMLVEVFIRHARGRTTELGRLLTVSGSAPATAERYLRTLEQAGHLRRHPDPDHPGEPLVAITDDGYETMRNFLMEGVGEF